MAKSLKGGRVMPATIPIDEAQAKLRELIHQLAPWEYPNRQRGLASRFVRYSSALVSCQATRLILRAVAIDDSDDVSYMAEQAITSRILLVAVRRGSPDPAVRSTDRSPSGSWDWRPSVGPVARSGDLATTGSTLGRRGEVVPGPFVSAKGSAESHSRIPPVSLGSVR